MLVLRQARFLFGHSPLEVRGPGGAFFRLRPHLFRSPALEARTVPLSTRQFTHDRPDVSVDLNGVPDCHGPICQPYLVG